MRLLALIPTLLLALHATTARTESTPIPGPWDARIRTATYQKDEIYRLTGSIGYQVSIEFAPEERFVGLAAGDTEGVAFEAQNNHLFVKPRAARVTTNLTVLTTHRHYYFEYRVEPRRINPDGTQTFEPAVYALRFTYPEDEAAAKRQVQEQRARETLTTALTAPAPILNTHYLYCGPRAIKPTTVTDDGTRTRFVFAGRSELPAIFTRAEDGTESLVNFTVTPEAVLVHRLAPEFILRRGNLVACVVNKGFDGAGQPLTTGTVSPQVTRELPIQPDNQP